MNKLLPDTTVEGKNGGFYNCGDVESDLPKAPRSQVCVHTAKRKDLRTLAFACNDIDQILASFIYGVITCSPSVIMHICNQLYIFSGFADSTWICKRAVEVQALASGVWPAVPMHLNVFARG